MAGGFSDVHFNILNFLAAKASSGWHDQQDEQNRDTQKAIAVVLGFSG
jgi:hypothetical protein